MGGGNKTTQATTQNSKTGPWSPTVAPLKTEIGSIAGTTPLNLAGTQPQVENLVNSIISGNPNANPYTNSLLDTIQNSVYNTLGSQFAGAGRNVNSGSFSGVQGSPGYAEAIARGLGQAEAPTLFANQNQMLSMIPQLAGIPFAGDAAKASLLAGLGQLGSTGKMSGTTVTTLPTNPLQVGIGAGLGGLGLLTTPLGGTQSGSFVPNTMLGSLMSGGILGL